jgi:hypothetical protein
MTNTIQGHEFTSCSDELCCGAAVVDGSLVVLDDTPGEFFALVKVDACGQPNTSVNCTLIMSIIGQARVQSATASVNVSVPVQASFSFNAVGELTPDADGEKAVTIEIPSTMWPQNVSGSTSISVV